ncbi:AAA domain-containing protein [Dichotomocladium elegans]|nr:AAA domain-containing protein [Dichotomocladium elegans]
MKSRKNCERICRKHLKENLNVVVDRCNFDAKQRSTWIRIAQEFGVPADCVVLTANEQVCGERILDRVDHPTGVEGDKGLEVLSKFVQNYLPPTPESGITEGIRRTVYLDPSPEPYCTPERVEQMLEMLK